MTKIMLIPEGEFHRIRKASINKYAKLALLADMCRANTLSSIKRAGSGHLGSSFSSLDIVTMLYYSEMNTVRLGFEHPDRDIYFSSKGHDVPGLYAVLFSCGILPREKFTKLRRLGGTCGHPDVGTPGIEVNSGSLGMGISKAKGMAFAKRLRGYNGRIFVMTGDGELQEGQIYEGLQTAVYQGVNNLIVIVDHNKVQSDKLVSEIIDLGDLESKFRLFGWYVKRCDGHDFRQLEAAFSYFRTITDKPKLLIADTIKGRGVSFMEHPVALKKGKGVYPWHSGAPGDQSFKDAYEPSPRIIDLPFDYRLTLGRGVPLINGKDAVLFAYGPVMVNEALIAYEILSQSNFHIKVVNMPWLNKIDADWLQSIIGESRLIFVLEDHVSSGGLADKILNELTELHLSDQLFFKKFAVKGHPTCGSPGEVLNHHGLNGATLAKRIRESYRYL